MKLCPCGAGLRHSSQPNPKETDGSIGTARVKAPYNEKAQKDERKDQPHSSHCEHPFASDSGGRHSLVDRYGYSEATKTAWIVVDPYPGTEQMHGVGYRTDKTHEELDGRGEIWGSVIHGHVEEDKDKNQWLKVGEKLYMPLMLDGKRVLKPKAPSQESSLDLDEDTSEREADRSALSHEIAEAKHEREHEEMVEAEVRDEIRAEIAEEIVIKKQVKPTMVPIIADEVRNAPPQDVEEEVEEQVQVQIQQVPKSPMPMPMAPEELRSAAPDDGTDTQASTPISTPMIPQHMREKRRSSSQKLASIEAGSVRAANASAEVVEVDNRPWVLKIFADIWKQDDNTYWGRKYRTEKDDCAKTIC